MAVALEIPREYGYIVLILILYAFNFWMGIQVDKVDKVGKARKRYKVFYPTLYAVESENKDAKLFNCVQRGHTSLGIHLIIREVLLLNDFYLWQRRPRAGNNGRPL